MSHCLLLPIRTRKLLPTFKDSVPQMLACLLCALACLRWRRLCRGRKIAMDVARGLDKMHSRHIIHLDLKSPNVLLTAGGTAKIAVSPTSN